MVKGATIQFLSIWWKNLFKHPHSLILCEMECIEFNWLCKHMEKVRSSQQSRVCYIFQVVCRSESNGFFAIVFVRILPVQNPFWWVFFWVQIFLFLLLWMKFVFSLFAFLVGNLLFQRFPILGCCMRKYRYTSQNQYSVQNIFQKLFIKLAYTAKKLHSLNYLFYCPALICSNCISIHLFYLSKGIFLLVIEMNSKHKCAV